MPIFSTTQCFTGYPLQAVRPALAAALADAITNRLFNGIVLRLECYLQVTQQTLDLDETSSDLGLNKLSGFIAALFSNRFHERRRPWHLAYLFRKGLYTAGASHTPLLEFPTTGNIDSWATDFVAKVREFDNADLDAERSAFWQGWVVKNADGKQHHLTLWPIHLRYGAEFTEELYQAARLSILGRRDTRVPILNQFARYLAAYPYAINFQNPKELGRLLTAFFEDYFRTAHAQGVGLLTASHRWQAFCILLEQHLLDQIWANPLPALPRPQTKKVRGANTNLRKTATGHEVKQALVTAVPLHVTDAEAKELLFRDIRRDVDLLMCWARAEIVGARERLKRRKNIAPNGIVSTAGVASQTTGLRYRLSRDNPDHLTHAAATFEARGFTHLRDGRPVHLIYPSPSNQTAWELGIPTHTLLLAHSTILVATHPIITTSFLENLNLFDKNGQQTGFVKTDAGWYLIGNKPRKGVSKAEQRVLLNAETMRVVRDLIDLTQPIREYLRGQGDDLWRRLFLATSSLGVMPTLWRPTQEAHREVGWLAERFHATVNINAIEAEDLARRFSLKRLRSSAGVLVYLETGSVEQMAKALGHEQWNPSLLDRYLPQPIQEFFVERWIRLFQAGIICEALKNSPYLLDASSFQSMVELDAFLEHHALKRIPAHLEDPDAPNHAIPHLTQLVFGIEVGILTLLVSLQNAVATATGEPCGRAVMWARVAERLVPHLEAQTEQPEFHAIVAEAKRHADAGKVEALIYG